jgi:uracil-DNA glycosylase
VPLSDEQVERNWPYFLEELRIIEPKIIVALGGWVFYTLGQRLNWPVSLRRVTHYSYRFISRSELEKRLRAELEIIRKDSGPA